MLHDSTNCFYYAVNNTEFIVEVVTATFTRTQTNARLGEMQRAQNVKAGDLIVDENFSIKSINPYVVIIESLHITSQYVSVQMAVISMGKLPSLCGKQIGRVRGSGQ